MGKNNLNTRTIIYVTFTSICIIMLVMFFIMINAINTLEKEIQDYDKRLEVLEEELNEFKDELNKYNETITLKIYHPNSDATKVEPKNYIVNKKLYESDRNNTLAEVINKELNLGIISINITNNKAVIDITKEASQSKFDSGSAGSLMSILSLKQTIFENTEATILRVTVEGQENVEGSHFSFVEDFVKE